jgi:two-component system copper resistance phosphate regulon response regulator CusR
MLHDMRILLVEDDPRLREVVARGLREAAHAVDEASCVAEARRLVAIESFDVVVLDVNLPDGSGFGLTRSWREGGVEVPILLLTARDEVSDRVAGLDAGADDYLVKPFAHAELLARLRALGRRSTDTLPPLLHVGDLEVDPSARQVRRNGATLDLTTTEYALLELLARHEGQVLGRERISASVWDENYDPLSNIIDVYVARLRRKLAAAGGVRLIHTVRGAGYVLDPHRGTTP